MATEVKRNLYIGVDEELKSKLKSEAALADLTLNDYCAKILKERQIPGAIPVAPTAPPAQRTSVSPRLCQLCKTKLKPFRDTMLRCPTCGRTEAK